jgi:hypothetical protein
VSDAAREKFMAAYDRAFIKTHASEKQAAQLTRSLRRL